MQVHVRREPITPCGVNAWVDTREPGHVTVRLKASEYTELDRLRLRRELRALVAELGDIPVSRYRHLLLVHTG